MTNVDPDERVEVSVIVRPRRPLEELELRLGQQPMSREEFATAYGADPSDLRQVEAFARHNGLEVIESSQPRRTVRVAGRAADVGAAFGVELQRVTHDGAEYRAPSGPVQLPAELKDVVQGVFGLDTRPVARRLT
jgi:kumamolisin